jgi:pimeloyl-ACP methyl ester carboxylesterase
MPSVFATDSWPSPNVIFSFGSVTVAYYQRSAPSGWIVVFLPGGQGSGEMLTGCAGKLVQMPVPVGASDLEQLSQMGWVPCWVILSNHGWLAAEFMNVGFDFIEPLTYTFTFGSRGWIISLLQYVRYGLGYQHVLLAGFSAGAAIVADLIAWGGSSMNGLLDAAAIYEGPTIGRGVLGSSNLAYNVTVPTFLVYGNLDGPTAANFPGVPPDSGQQYAENMRSNVPRQLIIVTDKGHDETVIVDTLPELSAFLSTS